MLAGAVGVMAVYLLVCVYGGMMPRCPFKWVTGFDCPGCGSQRALRALLQCHPMEAWSYNLILPPVVAYLLLILTLPLCKGERAARIHARLTSAPAIWTLLGVVILWWIVRNLPFWRDFNF